MRFLIPAVALTMAALLTGCDCAPADTAQQAGGFSVPVETVAAATDRVEDKITAVGTLEANEMVRIQSEVEGRITAVKFREGDAVQQGAVLFQLDDEKLKAALEAAEARFLKAKSNRERGQQLLEQKTISQQEFDEMQAEFKGANAEVALVQARLNDATIRSPLNGHISERLVSEGQYVEKNTVLVTLVDDNPLKLDFSVPERYLPQLQLGQKVLVRVAALRDKAFEGEVYFVDPRMDTSTRTVKIKAKVPNPNGELRPGLFANVELVVAVREQAIVIPEQALVPQIDKIVVFVVENGVAHRREVKVGARTPGKVEITDGVKPGEQVVIAGQQKLQDQVPVQPLAKGS